MITSLEDASIQKTWEKLGINENQELSSMVKYLLVRHLLDESQKNLSLPNTPMPYNKNKFQHWSVSLLLAVKCSLSLMRTSVRPVNQILEFGFTEIAALDVVLLPMPVL